MNNELMKWSDEMSEAQRKIEILESRASQFESTLKETVRAKDAEIAEITEKLRVAKDALEKYKDKSNWRYWSNHDIGAFKEEWTMWKQNCRGPELAVEALAKLEDGNE